ncbi:MAG: BON domain-containing protein [Acidobacteria bacterium]|nr:BON domain-containing protein [Acidobacteriota bacterium]
MNRNKLISLLTLAAPLAFAGCGVGGGETAGGNRNGGTTPSSLNASSPVPVAGATNSAPANGAAGAPSPVTTGGATPQTGAAPKGSDRASVNAPQANAPKPQIGSGGNDFYIFTQARGALNSDPELKSANITVEVKQGIVTLSGGLASAAQKAKAEQLVRAVGGVKDVKNQLRVSGGV